MHVWHIHGAEQMLPYEACIEYIRQRGNDKHFSVRCCIAWGVNNYYQCKAKTMCRGVLQLLPNFQHSFLCNMSMQGINCQSLSHWSLSRKDCLTKQRPQASVTFSWYVLFSYGWHLSGLGSVFGLCSFCSWLTNKTKEDLYAGCCNTFVPCSVPLL